jgi:iron complex outermembrane receptor protein
MTDLESPLAPPSGRVELVSTGAKRRACGALVIAAVCAGALPCAAQPAQPASPFDMSIEELGRIRVTTASRRAENLNTTPAFVHVITAEDIRRSGVTTIQQALRLAPGVEVARNGSNEWTISIRGFSNDLSNKLLVLIDGRSVYSPLFGGVFWDVQDTLLADIERIEIVAGPGGATWGANAVNGVINIITQTARDTQGAFAEVGGGNEEEIFGGFRYGWKPGEKLYARASIKSFQRDASVLAATGASANDDWEMTRAGFALTWDRDPFNTVNVRADVYDGEESALLRGDFTLGTLPQNGVPGEVPLSGHSVLATWIHTLAEDANWRIQFYYDDTDREIPGSFNEDRDTYNVLFQHDLVDLPRHDVQWGVEARSTTDHIGNTQFSSFIPDSRTDQTLSAFAQDRIMLAEDRFYLTLGTKVEHNDYTGVEHQPSVRFTWLPAAGQQTFWAAVAEAVRVPARLNTDLRLYAPVALPGLPPLYINVNGNPDFRSEELTAYEAGYRTQLSEHLSLDLAIFENSYDRLFTQEQAGPITPVPGPPPYLLLPVSQQNLMEGETRGGSVVLTWQPIERWRLQFHASVLDMDLELKPGSADVNSLRIAGNSPEHHYAIQSYIELGHGLELYTSLRHVDELPSLNVPSYDTVDVSLGWRPTEKLRASLTVQSLNDAERLEFNEGRLIERSGFARLVWSF